MRKGREEVLKTNLEIRKLSIIRTIISIIIIDIMAAAFILLLDFWIAAEDLSNIMFPYYIFIISIIDILFIFFLYQMTKQELEGKNSKIFVRLYLSEGEPVEVIPIKVDSYSDFIFGLTDISRFYAITNRKGNKVEIRVKLDNESESRYFEQIYSSYFTEYYKIKSDKEEDEKE